MRKFVLILLAVILLFPMAGECAKKKKTSKKNSKKDEQKEEQKKPVVFYRVHFKTGGVYEVDNYTIEKEHIMLMLDSGPIFLDKNMVTTIEKFDGDPDKPKQRINVSKGVLGSEFAPEPAPEPETGETVTGEGRRMMEEEPMVTGEAPAMEEAPAPPSKPEAKPEAKPETKAAPYEPEEEVDDEGHDERWWKIRVNKWVKLRKQAIERYKTAEEEWIKYDGILSRLQNRVPAPLTAEQQKAKAENPDTFVEPTQAVGSSYDIQRYQDLRGSARIEMDRAKADREEAETMLNDTLPEEARRAGADSWWVDWDDDEDE